MADIFQFQQFAVDQSGCAMKVNTDGVLLGALADGDAPLNILDIGTGTGVMALMLAQRFPDAEVDAVEMNPAAAKTAEHNFEESPFSGRLTAYQQRFQDFFSRRKNTYDLIVSNPPFYIHSLTSPSILKTQAKHANATFFTDLVSMCAQHLIDDGYLWLVLPLETATMVKTLAAAHQLFPKQVIELQSYPHSVPHREIIAFGFQQTETLTRRLVIYNEPKKYSEDYQRTLKDFLTIFR